MHARAAALFLLVFLLPVRAHALAEAALASGVTGGEFVYAVRKGDTLTAVGARFGVSVSLLARANALRAPYRLRPGDRLRVNNVHLVPPAVAEGIVINIPQRMLFYFSQDRLAAAYPVALGRPDWQTPAGNYTVATLEKDKTWIVPPSIQEEMREAGKPVLTQVPPGPDNPLGGYWIGLSLAGYGIHGTNAPSSIYSMRTHGCIRLNSEDARALYEQVPLGTPVRIVYLPILLAQRPAARILVEANPDVYNRGGDALAALHELARAERLEGDIDWTAAAGVVRAREGIARAAGAVRSEAKRL